MEELAGRVVVVTGGASGVGRGIAEAFAAVGARLVLADVHGGRLDETAHALGPGCEVLTQKVDVRDAAEVQALADRAFTEFGAVHVVCNNAGVACNGLVWEHSPEDGDWVFETNVRGTLNGLRSFVPRLVEQQEASHVVNTASMLGLSSAPLTGIYGASKQAVLGLTEALRMDLAIAGAQHVGVSVLCPGPVRTNVAEEPGRPPVAGGTTSPAISEVGAALRGVVENGMDAREVGDRVVEGVRAGRFWILPAPEYLAQAEQRLAEIRAGIAG